MKIIPPEQKFNVDEIVSAKSRPDQRLKVRRYVNKVYYCTIINHPDLPDAVYFERELQNE